MMNFQDMKINSKPKHRIVSRILLYFQSRGESPTKRDERQVLFQPALCEELLGSFFFFFRKFTHCTSLYSNIEDLQMVHLSSRKKKFVKIMHPYKEIIFAPTFTHWLFREREIPSSNYHSWLEYPHLP